jgi:hypothetical protein
MKGPNQMCDCDIGEAIGGPLKPLVYAYLKVLVDEALSYSSRGGYRRTSEATSVCVP